MRPGYGGGSVLGNLKPELIALEKLRTRIGEIVPNVLQRVRPGAGNELRALQEEIARLEAEASELLRPPACAATKNRTPS